MCGKIPDKKQNSKKCGLSLVLGVFRAMYSPDTNFEAAALQGCQPPTSLDWVDLDTLRKVLTSCF